MKKMILVVAAVLGVATAALAAAPTRPCTTANDGEVVQVNVGSGRNKAVEFWTCEATSSTSGWWQLTSRCANGRCEEY